jgi:NAD(P)-dependent dehydrogenase (short-subunit alcohol dehydrogenase family)
MAFNPCLTPTSCKRPREIHAASILIGRLWKPKEVAKATAFLVSNHSDIVTGAELFVDDGRAQV